MCCGASRGTGQSRSIPLPSLVFEVVMFRDDDGSSFPGGRCDCGRRETKDARPALSCSATAVGVDIAPARGQTATQNTPPRPLCPPSTLPSPVSLLCNRSRITIDADMTLNVLNGAAASLDAELSLCTIYRLYGHYI